MSKTGNESQQHDCFCCFSERGSSVLKLSAPSCFNIPAVQRSSLKCLKQDISTCKICSVSICVLLFYWAKQKHVYGLKDMSEGLGGVFQSGICSDRCLEDIISFWAWFQHIYCASTQKKKSGAKIISFLAHSWTPNP